MSGAVLLFLLLAVCSIGVSVLVLAMAPWRWPVRVVVAFATVAVGFAPIVWLVVGPLSHMPPD